MPQKILLYHQYHPIASGLNLYETTGGGIMGLSRRKHKPVSFKKSDQERIEVLVVAQAKEEVPAAEQSVDLKEK